MKGVLIHYKMRLERNRNVWKKLEREQLKLHENMLYETNEVSRKEP